MEITEVICAIISAVSAVMVAVIGQTLKKSKAAEEKRAERRKKESMLSLEMMHSTMELSVGIAYALKRGKCNGEVEQGLQSVEKAERNYRDFERQILAEEIT